MEKLQALLDAADAMAEMLSDVSENGLAADSSPEKAAILVQEYEDAKAEWEDA